MGKRWEHTSHLFACSADLPQPRDILAVPLRIVTVGKGNSPGATAMADEWLEKLRR